jgi:ribonuclease PH
MKQLKKDKKIETMPIKDFVAATSVGVLEGKKILDLDYRKGNS